MKRFLICIITILTFFTTNAQEHKEYFKDGGLKAIGFVINKKPDGLWKFFHENGELSRIGNFKNGMPDGIWKFYFPNGKIAKVGISSKEEEEVITNWKHYSYDTGNIKAIGQTINEKLNGIWKFYYPNGKLARIEKYENGIQNGEFQYYFRNGNLKAIGRRINNKRNGEWKSYNEKGELIKIEIYVNGEKQK